VEAPEAAAFAYQYLKERDVPCLIYQGRYNILNREPERAILGQAKESGVGFIAFSPLAQGLLTGRYLEGIPSDSRMAKEKFLKSSVLTPAMQSALLKLNGIAARRGQTLAEMALAWCLKDDRVTSVIIGASRVAQIEDDLKALENISFSAEELAEIDEAVKGL
jgi:L-glyceraldehyde 3-phosphate reductase